MANGYIQLPPDGTGKKTQTFTYQSGSDTVHQQTVVIVDADYPTRAQQIDQYGAQFVRFNEGPQQLDGLGNSKFSQTKTLQEYNFYYDKLPRLVTEDLYTGGTSVTSSNSSVHGITMAVTSASGSRVIRRSDKWHKIPYSCGGLVEMTVFHGDDGKAGHVRRWGYYDDEHGFMFELDGTTYHVGTRDGGVDTWYSQSQWNVDPLDGTGNSAFTATPTGVRRYWINFKPLGGEVKFGVYNEEGNRIVFHEVYDYFSRKDLPLTWEIFNTSVIASPSEFTHGGAYVIQEGVDEIVGKISTSFPGTTFTIPTGEDTVVFNIKSQETFKGKTNRIAAIPIAFSAYCTHPTSFRIVKNAVISGATWDYSTIPSSSVIADTTGTFVGGGNVLANWFSAASSSTHFHPSEVFGITKEHLHTKAHPSESITYSIIANIRDTRTPSGSFDVSMTWDEII